MTTQTWWGFFLQERLIWHKIGPDRQWQPIQETAATTAAPEQQRVLIVPGRRCLPFFLKLPFSDPTKIRQVLPFKIRDIFCSVDETWGFAWNITPMATAAPGVTNDSGKPDVTGKPGVTNVTGKLGVTNGASNSGNLDVTDLASSTKAHDRDTAFSPGPPDNNSVSTDITSSTGVTSSTAATDGHIGNGDVGIIGVAVPPDLMSLIHNLDLCGAYPDVFLVRPPNKAAGILHAEFHDWSGQLEFTANATLLRWNVDGRGLPAIATSPATTTVPAQTFVNTPATTPATTIHWDINTFPAQTAHVATVLNELTAAPGTDLSGFATKTRASLFLLLRNWTLACVAMLLLVYHGNLWWQARTLEQQANRLRSGIANVCRQVLPNVPLVEPITQMAQLVRSLERDLQNATPLPDLPWTTVFTELHNVLPESITKHTSHHPTPDPATGTALRDIASAAISIRSVRMQATQLQLQGKATSYKAVQELMQRLQTSSSVLSRVSLQESRPDESHSGLTFTLEGEWHP